MIFWFLTLRAMRIIALKGILMMVFETLKVPIDRKQVARFHCVSLLRASMVYDNFLTLVGLLLYK